MLGLSRFTFTRVWSFSSHSVLLLEISRCIQVKFGLSLVPLNPSTFNRVYIVGKGILVRSRYRDGPVVAGAAIVMHYCIMSPHNRGSLPAFSQFLPPVTWVCRLFEILCSHPWSYTDIMKFPNDMNIYLLHNTLRFPSYWGDEPGPPVISSLTPKPPIFFLCVYP